MAAQEKLKPSQQVRQPMPSASALIVVVFFNSMLLLLCSVCECQSQRQHLSGHTVSIFLVSEKTLAQVKSMTQNVNAYF